MSSAADGYFLLDSLELPADLQRLEVTQLAALAAEVRALLTRDVAIPPERLAAGRAAVELAIAVDHVFDTSTDRIVWDGGDQGLAHALLSGRRKPLYGHPGGAPPFPPRPANGHDAPGAAHCGAAIGLPRCSRGRCTPNCAMAGRECCARRLPCGSWRAAPSGT